MNNINLLHDGCALCAMVIIVRNGIGDLSSNPGKSCSLQTNTLEKGMNPSLLPNSAKLIGK